MKGIDLAQQMFQCIIGWARSCYPPTVLKQSSGKCRNKHPLNFSCWNERTKLHDYVKERRITCDLKKYSFDIIALSITDLFGEGQID